MKKNIISAILVFIATIAVSQELNGKYEGLGKVGAGMMQNASSPYAENRSDKSEYLAFMAYGSAFKNDSRSLYPGLSMNDYIAVLPTMQWFHNKSFCTQLGAINDLTKGRLGKDFGWAPNSIVTIQMAMDVFASDKVTYGLTPEDTIIYDGVKVKTKNDTTVGSFTIPRKFHLIGKNKAHEMGWWLHVTGYAPIFIKSAYCNNNVGTAYIAAHLVKLPDPVVVVPNVVPCTAKVPNVIGSTTAVSVPNVVSCAAKVPNVVPCTAKVPNVIGSTTAVSLPNVVNQKNNNSTVLMEDGAQY